MEYGALVFSLLFFGAFAIYLFFGVYIIHIDPKGTLNRVFFALCVALCIWSLGFAMANSAPTHAICLRWRRISAFGWGSVYCILLHFVLLLSGRKCVQKPLPLCSLIYLPAVINVFGYCLLDFAKTQYNLTRARFGWINLGVQSNLDMFFNIHYISYVLLSIAFLWMLRRKAQDGHLKKQSSRIKPGRIWGCPV
ncbi:MAG TPA: histidine kinase N-terminal 7TM domain-containing protein [Clostridia bacterium]|nr:histidine kinase N-terminal 7TM domain-containing protein [Clostridia bacterium]